MLQLFRSKHSQYFVFAVLALLFLSFLFYSNAGSSLISSGNRQIHHGKIDGREISGPEYRDAEIGAELAAFFGGRQDPAEVWVDLLMQKEAEKLGVSIPPDAIVQLVHESPIFMNDKGVYDPSKFTEFTQRLQMQNLTEDDFTQALNRKLVSDGVGKALFGNIHAPKSKVEQSFEKLFGPVSLTIWRFDPVAFEKDVVVTPTEEQNEYKAHSDNPAYREDEKREVEYVIFNPPAGQSLDSMTKEQKGVILQAAIDFCSAFQNVPGTNYVPPTFENETKQFPSYHLQVQSSGLITAKTPARGLPPSPHFNNAAFQLTHQNPIGHPVQVGNGLVVMHLIKIEPGPLKDFKSVEPAIISSIKAQKGKAALQLAESDLSSGKLAGSALQAFISSGKITETKQPIFDPVEPPSSLSNTVGRRIEGLEVGKISEAFSEQDEREAAAEPTKESLPLTVIRLDSRDPVSAANRDKYFSQYAKRQDAELQSRALYDWVIWKSSQPGTEPPPDSPFGATSPNS